MSFRVCAAKTLDSSPIKRLGCEWLGRLAEMCELGENRERHERRGIIWPTSGASTPAKRMCMVWSLSAVKEAELARRYRRDYEEKTDLILRWERNGRIWAYGTSESCLHLLRWSMVSVGSRQRGRQRNDRLESSKADLVTTPRSLRFPRCSCVM